MAVINSLSQDVWGLYTPKLEEERREGQEVFLLQGKADKRKCHKVCVGGGGEGAGIA